MSFWNTCQFEIAKLRAKAEDDPFLPLNRLYEAETGTGDAPVSDAGSPAYL